MDEIPPGTLVPAMAFAAISPALAALTAVFFAALSKRTPIQVAADNHPGPASRLDPITLRLAAIGPGAQAGVLAVVMALGLAVLHHPVTLLDSDPALSSSFIGGLARLTLVQIYLFGCPPTVAVVVMAALRGWAGRLLGLAALVLAVASFFV